MNQQTTFVQHLSVLDERGDLSFDARYDTGDIKVDIQVISTNVTLTAYPGVIRYLIDTSAGDVTVTLPALTIYEVQYFELQQINDSGNTVNITGTINGTTGHTLTANGFMAIVGAGETPAWFELQYSFVN